MSKTPALSFCIPVYKKPPEVFERCLDSLFDQSFKDFEVICVFDGPDPDLEAVAKKFKKVKSVVIEHAGAPAARNTAFRHSKGQFISFWDADCYAKPEMATVWMQTFERNPGAAFVYSGYEFAQEGMAPIEGEPFDLHSLQSGNYIATMFPVKRQFVVNFDESLKGAQDWDFWLTIAENGGKGVYIQGYGFITEPSYAGSLSWDAWSQGNRDETIRTVKTKHGISRSIGVYGPMNFMKALHIAKILNGDVIKASSLSVKNYDMVINVGYSPMIRFEGVKENCAKVQYWMPWDIDCLEQIAHRTAKETIRLANLEVDHHFCNEMVSKKRLESLGIVSDILPLPTEIDDLETALPATFRVLIDTDKAYAPITKDIEKDLPYIAIDRLDRAAPLTNYSLLVSFYEHPTIDEAMRKFILNGRNVISNVQAPFCGFLDLQVDHPEFRRELLMRIRVARGLPFNQQAKDYYKQLVDPSKFKERVLALTQVALEVV